MDNSILENLRETYKKAKLDINDCSENPFEQFEHWFKEALNSNCDEPNAFVLSTVVQDRPRARVVLLKGVYDKHFVFFTNYDSAKGREIQVNNKVSMTFLWLPLQRQVRIEGTISYVHADVSDEYFKKRPRGSQLGAIASPQSEKVESRDALEKFFIEANEKFATQEELPRPKNWGGYGVVPTYFEFWQGRDNRMHDRICFEKSAQGWERFRLAP